jgi:hypothetical protein
LVIIIPLLLVVVIACISLCTPKNNSFAENGVGKEMFKVIVSIYGIKNNTGDITAIVTVDDHSNVKTFYLNKEINNLSDRNVLKFAAAFPNVTIKSGETYKACVVKLSDMQQYCHEGKNSSIKGPEFIGISLDKNVKIPDTKIQNTIKNKAKNEWPEEKNNILYETKNVLPNYSKIK